METAESLKRKIGTTGELHTLVRTMKAMAAVNIRQFQKAVQAVHSYHHAVELGLQIVLRGRHIEVHGETGGGCGAVVFGSDQGMCGQFNEQVAAYFEKEIAADERAGLRCVAVGTRLAARLAAGGQHIERLYNVPGSVERITPVVSGVVRDIERWQADAGVGTVFLFHNRQEGAATFVAEKTRLMPVDQAWVRELQVRRWGTRMLPVYLLEYRHIFSALVRQYLFVTLYRAFAESVAAENAARLAAMQAAERNIEERLQELTLAFQQERQTAITEELLDIVAGFEALMKGGR